MVVASLGVALLAAGTAEAATSPACGAVLTTSTKLSADLLDCPGSGLVIGASNITVDLAGHTVDGLGDGAPFASAGVDNSGGYDGVVVKNGTVTGFDQGLVLVGTTGDVVRGVHATANRSNGFFVDGFAALDSTGNQLIGNEAAGNGADGITLRGSSRNTIRANTAAANAVRGVSLTFSSQGNLVSANTLSDNGGQGLLLLNSADDNDLNQNRVLGNDLAGILVAGSSRNRLVANTVSANVEGIDLAGSDRSLGSDQNVLARNLVTGNAGDGIFVYGPSEFMGIPIAGATGTALTANVTNDNGDDGIDVRSAATTLTRNGADRNVDMGIDAVPGVTDGGGNHATGNGGAGQCAGVACK